MKIEVSQPWYEGIEGVRVAVDAPNREDVIEGQILARRLPAPRRTTFDTAYPDYIGRQAGTYSETVTDTGKLLAEHIRRSDTKPAVWVCIPTRDEPNTGRAVQTIHADLADTPHGVVLFHNYVNDPSPKTIEDLEPVGRSANVFLMEQEVPQQVNIGMVRGFCTDVALSAAHVIGQKDPLVLSTDADLTRFQKPGTVQRAIDFMRQNRLDALGMMCVPDAPLLLPDEPAFFQHTVRAAFDQAVKRLDPRTATLGAGTLVRGAALAAMGGYPPLSMMEDSAVGRGIAINYPEGVSKFPAQVFFDPSRQAGMRRMTEYYGRWDTDRTMPERQTRALDWAEAAKFLIETQRDAFLCAYQIQKMFPQKRDVQMSGFAVDLLFNKIAAEVMRRNTELTRPSTFGKYVEKYDPTTLIDRKIIEETDRLTRKLQDRYNFQTP